MSTRYVWEKWNAVYNYKYEKVISSPDGGYNQMVSGYDITPRNNLYTELNFNENTGQFSFGGYQDWVNDGKYCLYNGNYHAAYHTGAASDYELLFRLTTKYTSRQFLSSVSKGSTSYGNISSTSSGAYPANNYSGSYWYVSKGSDTIDPSAVTYDPNTVIAGQDVAVIISPSSGNVYGGTITYSIEVNIDETGWEPYTETTQTSFTFTIPEDAVSWRTRVKAKDNTGFASSTYVYGNNAIDEPTTVIYPKVFAVMPEDKNIGFASSSSIITYLATTEDDIDYQISVSLNGKIIQTATETPKARTLVLSDEVWDDLETEIVHTIIMAVTSGDEQIQRTYKFKKFIYNHDTLYNLFTGIARATRIKRAFNRRIPAADFPKEILKISAVSPQTVPSYIDVVLPYVEGGTIIVVSATGDTYSANIDESGTTRITVDYVGNYTIQGYVGDSPSSSGSVTIEAEGDVETVTLSWIRMMLTVEPGANVVAYSAGNTVTGQSGESGTVALYLPTSGTWSLSATHEDYSFTAENTAIVDGYGDYDAEIDFVSPTFEENNWETIQRIVREGKAASYWNVGDCKTVTLNGTVGG